MSNLWCACFTTETRRPRILRAGIRCSTSVVLPDPEKPAKPTTFIGSFSRKSGTVPSDESFDRLGVGGQHRDALGQLLYALEPRRAVGLAAQRLDDGRRELDRQRRL